VLDSQFGKVCIILYALFAIGSYVTSFVCAADVCGFAIVWPILPWAFIVVSDLGLSFPWAMYPVFILLNVSVAYVFGAGIEWVYRWYTEERADSPLGDAEHKQHTTVSS
jgi:hypothetical protein